ncbi:MAG: VCBS repeat-containing protein [Sedimentisphaerales bacterium]|nr:VCBS repeat-containing protein [Sedimentisphaerales bacterium]
MMETLKKIGFLIFFGILMVSCTSQSRQSQRARHDLATDKPNTIATESLSKALEGFNKGAALLEQYKYAEAAKTFEGVLDIVPDWTAARFNLGLAYFNMQAEPVVKEYLTLTHEAFEAVLESKPDHLHARFCLGLYYQHLGQNEKALEYFRSVHEEDRNDPYVLYKYAETLISLGLTEEGTKSLEKVIAADPGFISAIYRLATQYQRTNQYDKARSLFARFKELKDSELTGGTFTVLKTYGTIGKYYMALGADNLTVSSIETPRLNRILFSPETKPLNIKTSSWKFPGGNIALAGIAVGDIDNDGDLDLCITSFGARGDVLLWNNNGSGNFSNGTLIAQKGICPCFADVDNDGDLDLWLGRAGPDFLFENDGKGNFIKSETSEISGGDLITPFTRLFDIDSDGDLDFLASHFIKGTVPATEPPEPATTGIYNNNRDGSFTDISQEIGLRLEKYPVSAIVYDDFDNDRDMDLVVFSETEQAPLIWVNDRIGKYRTLKAETTGLLAKEVLSATSADPDKDGDCDLLVFTKKGLYLFVNQGGFSFTHHQNFANRCARLGGTGGQFADMDNDGDLDIIIADSLRHDGSRGPALLVNDWPNDNFIDVSETDPGNLLSVITTNAGASCVAADFTGNGRCDILLAPTNEKPFLIENITPAGHWIEIDLHGTRKQDKKSRSNNSAIGARVEVKAGTISQQYVVGNTSGPVAMAPHRIHAGLGQYAKVDWLRIIWPDAVLQAELEIPADQIVTIEELQRKVSSCPHLFAWNGLHFELVSDFGGMGGIGYLLVPNVYSKPDPTEYVPIFDIKPRDGEYIFQILEPIEEVVYFDEAKLIAVDHPADTKVYPHEMMAINAPPPPFELFCFKDTITPIRAVDHQGTDVTDEIRLIDRCYAGATVIDTRFVGFANDHFVELDFGNRLKEVSPQSRLVLFLYGSVEYPYSATNFAASQAGVQLKPPSIHVLRDGTWVEIFHEIGYPAGIQHMMTLEVTGKILPGDRKIRISGNMELFWDQIFIAPMIDDAGLHIQEVPAKNADLHFLGFPREYSPDGKLPTLYDYDSADRAVAWKIMEGNYTRYGEVTELLEKADDCYAVMGRGEEITLRFDADAFDPIQNGYRRTFILKTDSFCKDMDLYSAHPDTVEPLPFHSMSNYPYGPNEKYPDDKKHREYQEQFNTRSIEKPGN